MPAAESRIVARIERELGLPGLAATLGAAPAAADLQSLLIEVSRRRAAGKKPPALLADYTASRFVQPADLPPQRLLEWDRLAYSLLPDGFAAVELAPVGPLGTASVMAGVAQAWAVATERNNEVVSDSTNLLALEAACRRREHRRRVPGSAQAVHLAASHRVLRAQRYPDPAWRSHFRLFGLCSAGRLEGGGQFERRTLPLHLRFHLQAARATLGPAVPLEVALTLFAPRAGFAAQADAVFREAARDLPGVACRLAPERTAGRGYYDGLCFHVHATTARGERVQLADGGAVAWTARLLADAKEAALISGLGSERLCGLAT